MAVMGAFRGLVQWCQYAAHQFEMHEMVMVKFSSRGKAVGAKMPCVMRLTVVTQCVILELIKALRPISRKCSHFCN